jgi:hypothetical protein
MANGAPSAQPPSSADGADDCRGAELFCVSFSPPSYPQITQIDADGELKSETLKLRWKLNKD